jgi:hypothetical protein
VGWAGRGHCWLPQTLCPAAAAGEWQQTCIIPNTIAFCLLRLLPADDLFLDEVPEQQSGGFLSLLTGGSRPAAAAVVANAV